MDPFTAGFISSLTSALSANILTTMGRSVKKKIFGSEKERALTRCIQAGIVPVVTMGSSVAGAETVLPDIFTAFFNETDTALQLGRLLSGEQPNISELQEIFMEAGYDPHTLPGFDFKQAMDAFAAAFLMAAKHEDELRPVMQIEEAIKQTHLQETLVGQMADLIAMLKDFEISSISAGKINAQNVVSGNQQIIYKWNAASSTDSAGDWEKPYLRRLIERCDVLDIAAVDELGSAGGKDEIDVRISDVFTTLNLTQKRYSDQSIEDAVLKEKRPEKESHRHDEREVLPIPAIAAAGTFNRLVILGKPGGGKTTLVNHMVTRLAARRLNENFAADVLPGWPEKEQPLPVRIILRLFTAWIPESEKKGCEGLIWDYLHKQLADMGCGEFHTSLRKRLENEGGVVFFDGLDEVGHIHGETRRVFIKDTILDFARSMKKCRVVVTCREYAYQNDDAWVFPKNVFTKVHLDLFAMEQIEAFTTAWYRTIGPLKEWDTATCDTLAGNLVDNIEQRPHLKELAVYPLLLTLMSQMHGRDGFLPDDRAELYERAVNLLLARWENRIIVDISGRSGEDGEQKVLQLNIPVRTLRDVLEKIALSAHERQQSQKEDREKAANIHGDDVRMRLIEKLKTLEKANQVIEYIQMRAGLLQAKDNNTYAFPHRTFQEYLAATCILTKSDYKIYLREKLHSEQTWWQEVFLLAAGRCRQLPSNIEEMVSKLVPYGPEAEHAPVESIPFSVLAAQAFRETGFLKHVDEERKDTPGSFCAVYERVQSWLTAALRSDSEVSYNVSVAAGNALAGIGDPRFRADVWYLPDDAYIDWVDETLLGFIEIPEGEFLMGSDIKHDPDAWDEEKERHSVTLPAFYMACYPVTVDQFRVFAEENGDKVQGSWEAYSYYGNHPVCNVTWHDAVAYCQWLTENIKKFPMVPDKLVKLLTEEGWRVCLPSEAQWEKAARGTDGRIYPWGDTIEAERANFDDTGVGDTSAVGCFPTGRTPYGCLDMAGNVWEWTRSLYDRTDGYVYDYPYFPDDGREDESAGTDISRVIRGGAFDDEAQDVRCACRYRFYPVNWYVSGFRVVVAPDYL